MALSKSVVYILLVFCIFLMCSSLSVVTPFFPPYAMEKGVSEEIVGLIISSNPIGAFFASLYLGKILDENNRYFYMISGMILQATGMFVFALTQFLNTKVELILVGISARMISGMGASCFITSFYAYIPLLYPNNIEKMIGFSELAAGMGFLFGPIAGSFLYNLGGYLTPFLSFGGATFLITPLIYWYIQSTRKVEVEDLPIETTPVKTYEDEDNREVPLIVEQLKLDTKLSPKIVAEDLRIQQILHKKNQPLIQSNPYEDGSNSRLEETTLVELNKQANVPVPNVASSERKQSHLSPRTKSKYEEKYSLAASISEVIRGRSSTENLMMSRFSEYNKLGYLQVLSKYTILMTFMQNVVVNFVIMYFAPTLASFFEQEYGATPSNVGLLMSVYAVTYTISSVGVTFIRNHKRGWLLFANLLIAVGFLFMAPDLILKYHSLAIVLFAQGVIGIGVAVGFILSLPTLNDLILSFHPNMHLESANIASALFNASMSIGELIGPITAGFLTKYLGFEKGCVVTAFGLLACALLYIPVVLAKLQVFVVRNS